jgi:DNA gyrase subunit B
LSSVIDQFSSRRDKLILENLALYDVFSIENLKDIKKIKSWCASFMKFLNMNTPINIKFNLSPSDQSAEDKTYNINIQKTINGVTTNLDPLNKHFFSSDSYLDLVNLKLQHYASSIFKYRTSDSDDESPTYKLKECLNSLIDLSKRSMTLQRYKGLGEMNPSQLEETTMNTKSRTLLKVLPLEDLNQVVVELMGDDVEPRREFIKQKYSSVKNLDI